jgi:hypothetical protein
MTNDKMPGEIWAYENKWSKVPYTHHHATREKVKTKYIRADLCPKPEKIEGLLSSIERAEHDYRVGNNINPNDFDDITDAARAYLKLTEG